MTQLIDKAAIVAEIERLKEKFVAFHNRDGVDWPLDNYGKMRAYNELLSFLDTLEVKEVESDKERNEREHRYWEASQAYWRCVLRTIDNKRVLPTFKGQLLHDFKNELHTMKQIVGLINHPEIHEGLFDKLALVFAAWGGYHFHPTKTEAEDTIKEVDLEKEVGIFTTKQLLKKRNHATGVFHLTQADVDNIARHFYELGLNAQKGE